ncbi:type II toxin-antitoxin system HipA family toxin, partial [Vibrio campbellii]
DVSNALEVELAFEVAEYFQVEAKKADDIYQKVATAVSRWEELAKQAGIGKGERDLLRDCFQVP